LGVTSIGHRGAPAPLRDSLHPRAETISTPGWMASPLLTSR